MMSSNLSSFIIFGRLQEIWVQNNPRRAEMTKQKYIFLGFILLLIFSVAAYAGSEARIGTAGAQELLLPVGARGIALQGANIATITGTEAIYWNPAGLAASEKSEAMFSYMNWIADINLTYLAVGAKVGNAGSFGITFRTLDIGDIPVTTIDRPDGTGEMYSPTFLVVGGTYSRRMTDRINFGFSANFISERVQQMRASGMSFDFGVQYRDLLPGFHFGVALKNLGPDMKFSGNDVEYFTSTSTEPGAAQRPAQLSLAKFDLPVTFELGFGYNYNINEENYAALYGNFRNFNLGNDQYMGGLEYGFRELFFLRAGYMGTQNNDNNIFGPSFGAGVQTDLGGTVLSFDYTYRSVEYFDGNQFFSLRFGF
jgi:hypothetical protein